MNILPHQTINPNFQAKFLHSESLKLVADYAVEKGKFDKLNQARKNIDTSNLTSRLRFDIGEVNGRPFVTFARYDLKPNVVVPQSLDDYKAPKFYLYESCKKCDMLKFAYERIIKMGNNVPNNRLFRQVVLGK